MKLTRHLPVLLLVLILRVSMIETNGTDEVQCVLGPATSGGLDYHQSQLRGAAIELLTKVTTHNVQECATTCCSNGNCNIVEFLRQESSGNCHLFSCHAINKCVFANDSSTENIIVTKNTKIKTESQSSERLINTIGNPYIALKDSEHLTTGSIKKKTLITFQQPPTSSRINNQLYSASEDLKFVSLSGGETSTWPSHYRKETLSKPRKGVEDDDITSAKPVEQIQNVLEANNDANVTFSTNYDLNPKTSMLHVKPRKGVENQIEDKNASYRANYFPFLNINHIKHSENKTEDNLIGYINKSGTIQIQKNLEQANRFENNISSKILKNQIGHKAGLNYETMASTPITSTGTNTSAITTHVTNNNLKNVFGESAMTSVATDHEGIAKSVMSTATDNDLNEIVDQQPKPTSKTVTTTWLETSEDYKYLNNNNYSKLIFDDIGGFEGDFMMTSNDGEDMQIESHEAISEERSLMKESASLAAYHVAIALIIGLIVLLVVIGLVIKRAHEVWQRRLYHKMDFLIDGMYNNS